jgi:hypothetical protein
VHDIQLHRLDLHSGESVQMTDGRSDGAHWQPWGEDPARGISGDRSALAPQRGEVVYFDGQVARSVCVHTLEHRDLFTLPDGRFAMAQNCITEDERWFVYVHVDRVAYERLLEMRLENGRAFREQAHTCRRTILAAFHLDTGEHRTLFAIDYPVHHVHPFGRRSVAFSHIPGDLYGMGVASVDRAGYSIPRPQDELGGKIIHHVPTAAGIAYEVVFRPDGSRVGICDPHTGRRLEWAGCPGTNHTGQDPLGRLFFYQVGPDAIGVMRRFDPDGQHDWEDLFGSWKTFGQGQKTHFHPRLVLGRRWMQLVAGDKRTQTNHIFLVDVADLDRTEGLPAWECEGEGKGVRNAL